MASHPDLFLNRISDLFRRTAYDDMTADWFQFVSSFIRCSLNVSEKLIFITVYPTEYIHMANFRNSVFSNLTITDEHKAAFDKWYSSDDVTALSCLTEIAGCGLKFSCSYVDDQNAFCFSLIGTKATKKHDGYVMTTWSDDLEEVIAMAAYKHFIICNGDEWPTNGNGNRWG